MFASRIHRRTVTCAIACALLGSALTWVAPAGANQPSKAAAARAQERYYTSYSDPEPVNDGPSAAALAQERYYASYGEPEPLTVAQSPEPSDDTPWLPIALSVAVALALVAASATLARRLRIRRRGARIAA